MATQNNHHRWLFRVPTICFYLESPQIFEIQFQIYPILSGVRVLETILFEMFFAHIVAFKYNKLIRYQRVNLQTKIVKGTFVVQNCKQYLNFPSYNCSTRLLGFLNSPLFGWAAFHLQEKSVKLIILDPSAYMYVM